MINRNNLDTKIAFMYHPVLFIGNCAFLKFILIFPRFGEFGEPKFAWLENFYGTCLHAFLLGSFVNTDVLDCQKSMKIFLKDKNLHQTEVIDFL